jgi:propionate CoA-transferase
MGSISRMIRAQSTHSPGHITSIGIGTFCDPDNSGGAANDAARESPMHPLLVSNIELNGQNSLLYKALPIDVGIIRGTTSDSQGNITVEHESLLCDQKIIAAAAKNSGGIVIAQVKRMAADGSLKSRDVHIPGAFVDCVVVVEEKDHNSLHGMSYSTVHDAVLTGEIKMPSGGVEKLPSSIRKLIARRAFFEVRPNHIINLGIGLPEGVASVADEEHLLEYLVLSTEPGSFGGLPASGLEFGPSYNASSLVEMNQMFDCYDGGILDMCFLGAAEISKHGDVNASRIAKDRLTGPGGFIDISQSTKRVVFMTPMTTKGLKISTSTSGLNIDHEGEVKKFVNDVFEKTFSGDEAVRRGQEVLYVTERAVFRRTAKHDLIELIEIAPNIDVQNDIINQMDFVPIVSPSLKIMDERIYNEAKMNVSNEIFGSLEDRCTYHKKDHTMFLDLFGINLNTEDDVKWFFHGLREILKPLVNQKGRIDMVVQYDGFDIRNNLSGFYVDETSKLEKELYKSAKRYTGNAFKRAKLKRQIKMNEWVGTCTLNLMLCNINEKYAQ